MRDELSLPLLYSFVAHLVVIFVLTVKAVLFPATFDVLEPAIRLDIVDLPDKLPSASLPPPEVTQSPPAKEKNNEAAKAAIEKIKAAKDEPEIVLNPKKEKQKEQAKLSASEAIKKLKKQMAIEKIKEDIRERERQELANRVVQYKGNVLSPGTELTGVNKLQHEGYLVQLDRHVKNFWSLPEWLARGDYRARVRIQLDSQGNLIKAQLIKSSGNSSYDDTVLETVKKAVPFPVPPEKFRAILSVNGMVLGFPE